jgi:hypothetical protein
MNNPIHVDSPARTTAKPCRRTAWGFPVLVALTLATASVGCLGSKPSSTSNSTASATGGAGGTGAGGDDAVGGHGSDAGGSGGNGANDDLLGPGDFANDCEVLGDYRQWHRVAIVCDGPMGSEDEDATFTDKRMVVTFEGAGRTHRVFGHFAADGNAQQTGATAGTQWRAYFMPPSDGIYSYTVAFGEGTNLAVNLDETKGTPVAGIDGSKGSFRIGLSDKKGRDMRAHGLLQLKASDRYLRHAGSGRVFVEGGVGSPENLFGYSGFDNTKKHSSAGSCKGILHDFPSHASDWKMGDPTWGNDQRGKSLIGLVNYLASTNVNSVYLVAMSKNGDGCDGYPWSVYGGNHRAFDVSKLDQWDIVFSHLSRMGFNIHFVTQETENDQLLNGGDLGLERKLYYREIVSRFAHQPALQWNLGEENTNTANQQKSFSNYIKALDPYKHPVVMHTFPSQHHLYDALLGHPGFDGPTLQYGNIPQDPAGGLYGKTRSLIQQSVDAGKNWYVTATEAAGNNAPLPFQPVSPLQRIYWMYANAMAGGAGTSWYLKNSGQGHAYDLAVEDLREFDAFWLQTGHYVRLFNELIPADGVDLNDLTVANDLSPSSDDWILSKADEAYLVFLRKGGQATLTLGGGGQFKVSWFNPRTGTVTDAAAANGEGLNNLGSPPVDPGQDWVLWIRRE